MELRYEGEYKNDKEHGFGTSRNSDGSTYTGDWENGMFNGHGVKTFKNGSKVEG